jgi:hypothetical protein
VETSRAEIRRLLNAARDVAEQARAHASRAAAAAAAAAAGGGVWSTLLMRAPVDSGSTELEAVAAALELEARLRAAIVAEETNLCNLVAESDTAWTEEDLARNEAESTLLLAAECEATYRRERCLLPEMCKPYVLHLFLAYLHFLAQSCSNPDAC